MDCSPPDSSVHGIFQARILEWVAISFSRDLPDPGIKLRSPTLQADSLPSEPPGNRKCRRPRFDSWVWTTRWRRDRLPTPVFLGSPCGSAGKESTCNAGDQSSIPGLGRSPGEGKGYPLQYSSLENSTDSRESQRVGHDWATFTFKLNLATHKKNYISWPSGFYPTNAKLFNTWKSITVWHNYQ